MGDVTQALLLPDIYDPRSEGVRNLAVYWDQVVCPIYEDEEILTDDDPLIREGVVERVRREVPSDQIFPVAEAVGKEASEWVFHPKHDADGNVEGIVLLPKSSPNARTRGNIDLSELTDADLEVLTAITVGQHLGYVTDAMAIATVDNLAPVSHSVGGHLASLLGESENSADDAPRREAALLSVVVDAFSIDPVTTSEEILGFRARSGKAQARLRASLIDLSAQLRSNGRPAAMLSEARDVYRNRVEPALGDLEEVLKESRVRFLLKSVVGATAIALAPVEPVSTSVGAARMMGQTIDYAFSKSRVLREHPYGYLHEVDGQFGVDRQRERGRTVSDAMMAPKDSLQELWREFWVIGRDQWPEIKKARGEADPQA